MIISSSFLQLFIINFFKIRVNITTEAPPLRGAYSISIDSPVGFIFTVLNTLQCEFKPAYQNKKVGNRKTKVFVINEVINVIHH